MSDFAVLRIAKISTLRGLAGASAHNARTASSGLLHADNQAPLMGGGVRLIAGDDDAVDAWKKRTAAVGLSKPRKDAVRALEIVMSASPSWFAQASDHERREWQKQSYQWAAKTFGEENILSAHLHDDEETPHIHILAVPLAQKTRKKAGRPRKGREGQARKETQAWGLCAADFVGSPEKLVNLQTQYASAVSALGIRRGRSRRSTGAQHLSPAVYRAQSAEELAAAQRIREEAMDELTMAKEASAAVDHDAAQMARALTLGMDAVDQEELVCIQSGDGSKERLAWREVERPVLPTRTSEMRAWKQAVRPFFGALISYAKRVAQLQGREAQIDAREREASAHERTLSADAATVARMLERAGKSSVQLDKIRVRQKCRSK